MSAPGAPADEQAVHGSRAPKRDAVAGSGLANRVVATTLTHLRPGTTYHYRVVTSYCGGCAFGTSTGTDGTFRTLALPQLPGALTWQFGFGRSTTRVLSMVAHLPRGATRIIVTCAAHGCPSGRWTVATTASKRRCQHRRCVRVISHLTEVDVSPRLRGRALSAGGHITVEVLKRRYTGIAFEFTIRRSQLPEFSKRCLVTGARSPVVC